MKSPLSILATGHLYHYLLDGPETLGSILERGLLPLSARPENPRWQRINPDLFRYVYALLAEPVLQRPYTNSGVFLTPIDFRALPDQPLSRATRIAVPLEGLDTNLATLTYELDGSRVVKPLNAAALEEAAGIWDEALVRAWFGRDQSRMFFYVPQVAAYQEGGIPVDPLWVEKGGA